MHLHIYFFNVDKQCKQEILCCDGMRFSIQQKLTVLFEFESKPEIISGQKITEIIQNRIHENILTSIPC